MGNITELGGTKRATAQRDLRHLQTRLAEIRAHGGIVPPRFAKNLIDLSQYASADVRREIRSQMTPFLLPEDRDAA